MQVVGASYEEAGRKTSSEWSLIGSGDSVTIRMKRLSEISGGKQGGTAIKELSSLVRCAERIRQGTFLFHF